MACEVALGPLWNSLAAPSNEDILGQSGIWVFDFEIGKLDPSVGEFVDQVNQLALWWDVNFDVSLLPKS